VRHIRYNLLRIIILDYINFTKVKGGVDVVHALDGVADWRHRSSHNHKFDTRQR
jgi:hypothetical protein